MIMRASAPALVQKAMPRNQRGCPGRGSGRIAATAAITAGPQINRLSRKLNPITWAPNVAGVGLAEGTGVATVSSQGARPASQTVTAAAPAPAGRRPPQG